LASARERRSSPEEFGQFIRKETRYWAELIKKAKVELN
jgi:hypothetical protein